MTAATAPARAAESESGSIGINAFKPRILHTAYFVSDIERSLQFYTSVLGMQEQQRFELGNGVHEAVLGFPDSKGGGVILMWNTQRTSAYEAGDGYSRIVMSVSDLSAATDYLKRKGVTIVKPITEVGSLVYMLIKDPDGYVIELLQLKRSS
jgi:lactoylglutathione lyase